MKALVSVVAHSVTGLRGSRRCMGHLAALTPAALLLSGLLLVAVAPVPVAVAASGDWTQFRNGPTHEGYNTQESTLSASNVHSLGLAWTGAAYAGGDALPAATTVGISSPAVANGVVYVGSEDGKLYAFAVGCASGGGTCTPLWTGATGDVVDSSPAVANGVVYVGSEDGKLYAFAVGCASGGGSCLPLWTGTTGNGIYSSPAVANGVVYVGSDDDKLYAYAVGCNSGGGSCTPLWTGTTGDVVDSSPAVANGVVYVGSEDGKLYAFQVGCSSGGGTCSPLWTATTGGGIGSSPAVANGLVYVGSEDHKLYAFQVGCSSGGGTCSPLWTATTGGGIGSYDFGSSPAVANGVVYVGSAYGRLYAFAVGCASGGASCTPLWTGGTQGLKVSSPAVANGVVYFGSDELYAFAVGCASGGGTCTPLWTSTASGSTVSSPAVANGVVYVGSEDGNLYAFAPLSLSVSGLPSPYVAGVAHNVTVTAKDAHGSTVTGYRGRIHLTSTDSKAILPSDYTFTAADAGVHTFAGLTLKTVGSRSVTATDTLTPSITGTQSGISVTPAAATTLVVSGLTTPRTAGSTGSIRVTATDVYGNRVQSYLGTVHFTSSDIQAGLPANYKFTVGDAGTHVFGANVILKTVGTWSVTATDTVTATLKGSQSGIVVTPGALSKFVVSGLTSPRTHGTAGSLRVTATDAYGNRIVGYLGTIHLTSTDSKASLPANYKFTATDAGTHVFSGNVTLRTIGTWSVTATDTVTATLKGSQTGIVVN